jgi:hypothetical protein
MESLLEILSLACGNLDIDVCWDVFGGFDQTLVFSLTYVLAVIHSDPVGYICLTHLHNPYLIGLDRIFLPIEDFSHRSQSRSLSLLNMYATAKSSIVPSKLSCHMNC